MSGAATAGRDAGIAAGGRGREGGGLDPREALGVLSSDMRTASIRTWATSNEVSWAIARASILFCAVATGACVDADARANFGRAPQAVRLSGSAAASTPVLSVSAVEQALERASADSRSSSNTSNVSERESSEIAVRAGRSSNAIEVAFTRYGTLRMLGGPGLHLPTQHGSSPAARAIALLRERSALFGLTDLSSVSIVRTERSSSGGHLVVFRQSVRGVPVSHDTLEVRIDRDGFVRSITGGLLPERAWPSTEPLIGNEHARSAAGAARGSQATLEIYDPENGTSAGSEGVLAWRVDDSSGTDSTFVDARSGRVLTRYARNSGIAHREVLDAENVTPVGGTL